QDTRHLAYKKAVIVSGVHAGFVPGVEQFPVGKTSGVDGAAVQLAANINSRSLLEIRRTQLLSGGEAAYLDLVDVSAGMAAAVIELVMEFRREGAQTEVGLLQKIPQGIA